MFNFFEGESRTPEYLAVNPFGGVPCLVDEDFVLTERYVVLTIVVKI